VVQQWETTDWAEGYGPSRVELTFKAAGKGTELTMVHSDVPVEQKDELAGGWEEFYWKPLKEYFENKQKGKWGQAS
jgi:activator of HSP90 ATPase